MNIPFTQEKSASPYNGRINLMESKPPNTCSQFSLFDRIPVKTDSFTDALNGNLYDTELSLLYFSKENQELLQDEIRYGIYQLSKGSHVIGQQDYESLKTIMRSVFLQYSRNDTENLTEQIKSLNQIVLNFCVPQIYNELRSYLKYKQDISTIAVPIPPPILSKKNKQLIFQNRGVESYCDRSTNSVAPCTLYK